MDLLYITHPLNGIIMIVLPVALALYLTRHFKTGWKLFLIGAATFVLSQLGHIPFNYLLTLLFQRGVLPTPPEQYELIFRAVILGLSAGLWEEAARYASYRWWAKDARTWGRALVFGSGHGGLEAIILGLIVLITFIQMVGLRTMDLSTVIPPAQLATAQQQVETYWNLSWYDTLLGSIERISALAFHLSASVIVFQCFIRKQIRWLGFAILWHALLDAVAVYSIEMWGAYVAEVLIGVLGLASIAIIFILKTPEPDTNEKQDLPPVMDASSLKPAPEFVEEDAELLEKTRYN
jgi:uncharacterized membrane protein YhfC